MNSGLIGFFLAVLLITVTSSAYAQVKPVKYEKATFAGGCFWCMEYPFERLKGVKEAIAGYTGGKTKNPTYKEVCSGKTGHLEAVQVLYDPKVISYEKLLEVYWMQINPTDPGGQFADRGSQYNTAIFYHSEAQKKAAEKSKEALNKSGKFKKPVVTKILKADVFYRAEENHQDYYKKNSLRYKLYKHGSGREEYLQETWSCPLNITPSGK